MCYLNRILLSLILIGLPFTEIIAQTFPVSLTGANQNYNDSIQQKHLKDFKQRKSHIDTLLVALKHIIKETHQAIPFEMIQKRSQLQIDEAETLYRKGNHFTGRLVMDITYREVQDLVIQSRNGATLTQHLKPGDQYKVRSDIVKSDSYFNKLNASIDALMQALARVSAEKSMQHSTVVIQKNVAQLRERASILKASNDASGAIDSLNKAYSLTKGALCALREGDTLIMSLNFANKKEEYEYYLQKAESQKLALSMLAELNPAENKSQMLQSMISAIEPSLVKAMNLASADNYDSAVTIIENIYNRFQSGLMMALSSR